MEHSAAKILFIEDDKFLQELAIQKFTKEGFQMISAMDGERGILLAEKERPDVVLLDILLPGIDGFAVLERMHEIPVLKGTRVFMLSNYSQPEDVERARVLGAEKFLVKADYTLDQIVALIRESLAQQKAS